MIVVIMRLSSTTEIGIRRRKVVIVIRNMIVIIRVKIEPRTIEVSRKRIIAAHVCKRWKGSKDQMNS